MSRRLDSLPSLAWQVKLLIGTVENPAWPGIKQAGYIITHS